MTDIKRNEKFGYSTFFESYRLRLDLGDFAVARVTAEYKGEYKVKNVSGEYRARITGERVFHAISREDYPVVGDWVVLDKIDGDNAVIRDILPRRSMLKRRNNENDEEQVMAVNVDVVFIVESIGRDFNMSRLERYCAIARESNIEPIAVINKVDLVSENDRQVVYDQIIDRLGNIVTLFTSTTTGEGIDKMQKCVFPGETYCFLGSSGVGKSSLINAIMGEEILRVGDIGEQSGRGKHTTTHREMFFLDGGGIVIDNPGIREVGITDLKDGIDEHFDEIVELSNGCKFADCTHTHEPGCAVLEEVASGKLDVGAHENYVKLKKESDHYKMTKREKREKSRKFGKFIKTTKKDLGKIGHKNYGE